MFALGSTRRKRRKVHNTFPRCHVMTESYVETSPCPSGWNSSTEGYCFSYKGKGTEPPLLVKMMRLDTQLMVYAIRKDDSAALRHAEFTPMECIKLPASSRSIEDYKTIFVNREALVRDFDRLVVVPLLKGGPATNRVKDKAKEELKARMEKAKPKSEPTKAPQPTPRVDPTRPLSDPRPRPAPIPSGFDPFRPDSMLVGPRNPGFGGGLMDPRGPRRPSGRYPGRIPGARFDPFGPFGGGPRSADPDHLRIPGRRNPFGDDEDII